MYCSTRYKAYLVRKHHNDGATSFQYLTFSILKHFFSLCNWMNAFLYTDHGIVRMFLQHIYSCGQDLLVKSCSDEIATSSNIMASL